MSLFRSIPGLIFTAAITASVLPVVAEEEILVGRSAAGQLKVALDFAQPIGVEKSVFPGIGGYATGEVGVHSTILDDAINDLFQLSAAADFRFILLAKDPGMEVWNDTGTGFMGINETFYVGVPPFDTHPLWNIANGTPGNSYSVTLQLRDWNGIYPDSGPFTLRFTPLRILPQINLHQTDSAHATLSWPTNTVGWELQTTALLSAGDWEPVTNVPGITGTNFSLTVSTAGPSRFFRLHQQ